MSCLGAFKPLQDRHFSGCFRMVPSPLQGTSQMIRSKRPGPVLGDVTVTTHTHTHTHSAASLRPPDCDGAARFRSNPSTSFVQENWLVRERCLAGLGRPAPCAAPPPRHPRLRQGGHTYTQGQSVGDDFLRTLRRTSTRPRQPPDLLSLP